jgi:nucleotide-binding universal stress UspA family protein
VEAAQETFNDFLKKQGIAKEDIKSVFLENEYVNIAAHIEDYIQENKPDLVMMGAKGHTVLENFLYGSITEKFVDRCRSVPIMIIR